jgi:hypothetical protein
MSKGLVALMFAGGSVAGFGGVLVTAFAGGPLATASAQNSSSTCDNDHTDRGQGNLGDPGDGTSHHNEDVGKGNLGDPGNGGNKNCT